MKDVEKVCLNFICNCLCVGFLLSAVMPTIMEAEASYAEVVRKKKEANEDMGILEITIDMSKVTRYREYINSSDDKKVKISPPKETVEEEKKRTVVFKTVHKSDKKIGIMPTMDITKELNGIKFIDSEENYGKVTVKFITEEKAREVARCVRENKEPTFYPMYMGKHVTCIHVGRVDPEIELEWISGAVTKNMEDKGRSYM